MMNATNFEQECRRPHVVCVSYSHELLEMICTAFEEEGFVGTPLPIALETLETIATSWPDAIVFDLVPNARDSWQLLERIQANQQTKDIPRVITSTDAHALDLIQRQSDRYGGDRFIVKPFDVFELAEVVSDLVSVRVDDK